MSYTPEERKQRAYDANKRFLARNPGKTAEYNKRWRDKHPEAAKASVAKWRTANVEKERQIERRGRSHALWAKRHPEEATARRRRWHVANMDKVRAQRALNAKVRRGGIVKSPFCQFCLTAKARIEAHHPDYSKRFDVVWLCSYCHCAIEGKSKRCSLPSS